MPFYTCPTICGLLSTSAVFIVAGIVQLLSGIILLKTEHVFLLAGTDFLSSVSNLIVGCFLGMSASLWESTMKRISMNNAPRRNVLTGLYIYVVAINTTTAIIIIIGDGKSLLIAFTETSSSTSANYVGEILACAYVVSVCSPIVCIVVSIVCLSGNCLVLRCLGQSRKKRNKSTSSESYGFVFKRRPKFMSDSNSQSRSYRKSSLGDCLFEENKHLANPSLSTSEKPLKIWAQKRRKILQGITSSKFSLFSDDYLQFPEFNYDSHVGFMQSVIKKTSLSQAHSASTSLDHSNHERSSLSSTRFSNEISSKNDSPTEIRRATNNPSHQIKKNIDTNFVYNFVDNTTKISLNDSYRQTLSSTDQFVSRSEEDSKIFQFCPRNETSSYHPKTDNMHKLSDIRRYSEHCNDSKNYFNNERTEFGDDVFYYPNATNDIQLTRTKSDSHSVSFDFEPENLTNDPKMNLTVNPLEFSTISEIKSKLMKSFKDIDEKEHKSVHKSLSSIPRMSYLRGEMFPLSDKRPTTTSETRAEVIPLNVRNSLTNRYNTISDSTNELDSFKSEEMVNGELQKEKISLSKISLNDLQLRANVSQFVNKQADEFNVQKNEKLNPTKQAEEKTENVRNIFYITEPTTLEKVSNMGEICANSIQNHPKEISNDKALTTRGVVDENANADTFPADHEYYKESKNHNRRQSEIRYPCIFNGYPIDMDGKTDISNLIIDDDSLLGLSDKELLDRTGRIRQVRKSVELRSKERKNMSVSSNDED